MRDRSELVRFFHWLFSWRGIRRILIVLVWTLTAIALVYAVENWRGRRAWHNYRQQLQARGEQLDLRAFIPKEVPDDQNFAATPFVQSWFVKGMDSEKIWVDKYAKVAGRVPSRTQQQEKGRRHFMDLAAWALAFEAADAGKLKHDISTGKLDRESRARAAPAVLEGLKDSDSKLAELQEASRRPHSRAPVKYDLENPWGILLPHLAPLKSACQRLQLRACAKLALGQTESALEDIDLMLYLADGTKEEPFLISYLVRLACFQLAVGAVWEGVADHVWSNAQLQHLEKRLAEYNFFADSERPLDTERAAGILTADLLAKQKFRLRDLTPDGTDPLFGGVFDRIAPRGWYYLEQRNYCRLFDNQSAGTFDPGKKLVYPATIKRNVGELDRELAGARLERVVSHRVLATLLLPALGNVARRTATAQTAVDQAVIACTLERFRLAEGQLPDNLSALSKYIPQLPHDLVDGRPYKYRRTGQGQYLLYSVGWNERDDGGTPGSQLFDENEGDWLW